MSILLMLQWQVNGLQGMFSCACKEYFSAYVDFVVFILLIVVMQNYVFRIMGKASLTLTQK
jgi:hypothetical protein